ncbi:MAG: hypothetical protein ACOCQD_01295 [archaeon]
MGASLPSSDSASYSFRLHKENIDEFYITTFNSSNFNIDSDLSLVSSNDYDILNRDGISVGEDSIFSLPITYTLNYGVGDSPLVRAENNKLVFVENEEIDISNLEGEERLLFNVKANDIYNSNKDTFELVQDTYGPDIEYDIDNTYDYGENISFEINLDDKKYTTQLGMPYSEVDYEYTVYSENQFYPNYGFEEDQCSEWDLGVGDVCDTFILNDLTFDLNSDSTIFREIDLDPNAYSLDIDYEVISGEGELLTSIGGESPEFHELTGAETSYDFKIIDSNSFYFGFRAKEDGFKIKVNKISIKSSNYESFSIGDSGKINCTDGCSIEVEIEPDRDNDYLGLYHPGPGNFLVEMNATDSFDNSNFETQDFNVVKNYDAQVNFATFFNHTSSYFTRASEMIVVINSSEPIQTENLIVSYSGREESFNMDSMDNLCSPLNSYEGVNNSYEDYCSKYNNNHYYVVLNYSDLQNTIKYNNKDEFNIEVQYSDYLGSFFSENIDVDFDTLGLESDSLNWFYYDDDIVYTNKANNIPLLLEVVESKDTYKGLNYNLNVCFTDDDEINPYDSNNCEEFYDQFKTESFNYSSIECDVVGVNDQESVLDCGDKTLKLGTDVYSKEGLGEVRSQNNHLKFNSLRGKYSIGDTIDLELYDDSSNLISNQMLIDDSLNLNCEGVCNFTGYVYGWDEFEHFEHESKKIDFVVDLVNPEIEFLTPSLSNQTYGEKPDEIAFDIVDENFDASSLVVEFKYSEDTNNIDKEKIFNSFSDGEIRFSSSNLIDSNEFEEGKYGFNIYAKDKAHNEINTSFWYIFSESTNRPYVISNEVDSVIKGDNQELIFTQKDSLDLDFIYNQSGDDQAYVTLTQIELYSENELLKTFDGSSAEITRSNSDSDYHFETNLDLSDLNLDSGERLILSLESSKEQDGISTGLVRHNFVVVYVDSENTQLENDYNEDSEFFVNNLTFDIDLNLSHQTCELGNLNDEYCTIISDTSLVYGSGINIKGISYENKIDTYELNDLDSKDDEVIFDFMLKLQNEFPEISTKLFLNSTDIFGNEFSNDFHIFYDGTEPEISPIEEVYYINKEDSHIINITEITEMVTYIDDVDCRFSSNEGSNSYPETIVDMAETKPKSANLSFNLDYSGDGNYTFECYAKDIAGNQNDFRGFLIIDKNEPEIDVDFDATGLNVNPIKFDTWSNRGGKFDININDEFDGYSSGIKNFNYRIIQGECSNYQLDNSLNFNKGVTLHEFGLNLSDIGTLDVEDKYTFCYNAIDYAGNEYELNSFNFTYKDTKPIINSLSEFGCENDNEGIIENNNNNGFISSCRNPYFIYDVSEMSIDSFGKIDDVTSDNHNMSATSEMLDNNTLKITFSYLENLVSESNYRSDFEFKIYDGANNFDEDSIKLEIKTESPSLEILSVENGDFVDSEFLDGGKNTFFVDSVPFTVNFETDMPTNCSLCQGPNCDLPYGGYYDLFREEFLGGNYNRLRCRDELNNEVSLDYRAVVDENPSLVNDFFLNAILHPEFDEDIIISSYDYQKLGNISFNTVNEKTKINDYTKCIYFERSDENEAISNFNDWDYGHLDNYRVFHNFDFTDLVIDLSDSNSWNPEEMSGDYEFGIYCIDAAGNEMPNPYYFNFSVDLNEFAIVSVSPDNGEYFYETGEKEISVMFNRENSFNSYDGDLIRDTIDCSYEKGEIQESFTPYDGTEGDFNSYFNLDLNYEDEGVNQFNITCDYSGDEIETDLVEMNYTLDLSPPKVNITNFDFESLPYDRNNVFTYDDNLSDVNHERFISYEDEVNLEVFIEDEFSYLDEVSYYFGYPVGSNPEVNDSLRSLNSHNFKIENINWINQITELIISAEDVGGNSIQKKYYLINDNKEPSLEIIQDSFKEVTNEGYVFKFYAIDENLFSTWIELNGVNYSVDSCEEYDDVRYECSVYLDLETTNGITNNLTLFAKDYSGKTTSLSEEILIDTELNTPEVEFSPTYEGGYVNFNKNESKTLFYDTNTRHVRSHLDVDDDVVEARYKIESSNEFVTISVDDSTFYFDFSLNNEVGSQEVIFEIEDEAGNVEGRQVIFYYNDESPELDVDIIPEVTKSGEVLLRGVTSEKASILNISLYDPQSELISSDEVDISTLNSDDLLLKTYPLVEDLNYGSFNIILEEDLEDTFEVFNEKYISFSEESFDRYEVVDYNLFEDNNTVYTNITLNQASNEFITKDSLVYFWENKKPNFYFEREISLFDDGRYDLVIDVSDSVGNSDRVTLNPEKDSNLNFDFILDPPIYGDYSSVFSEPFEGYITRTDVFLDEKVLRFELELTEGVSNYPECWLENSYDDSLALPFKQEFKRLSENEFEIVMGEEKCVDLETLNSYMENNNQVFEDNYLCLLSGEVITELKLVCEDKYDSSLRIEEKIPYAFDFREWDSDEPIENICDYGSYCSGSYVNMNLLDSDKNPLEGLGVQLEVGNTLSLKEFSNIEGEVSILTRSGENKIILDNNNYFVKEIDSQGFNLSDVESNRIYSNIDVILFKYGSLNLTTSNSDFKLIIKDKEDGSFVYNGELSGRNYFNEKIEPGSYQYVIKKFGYSIEESDFTINEGEQKEIDIDLNRLNKVKFSGNVLLEDQLGNDENHSDIFVQYSNHYFDDIGSLKTNNEGYFEFDVYEEYIYNLSFERFGYHDTEWEENPNIPKEGINVELKPLGRADMGGYLFDTNENVVNQAEIDYYSSHWDTISNESGYYYFEDIFVNGDLLIFHGSYTPIWDDKNLMEDQYNEINYTLYPLHSLDVTFISPSGEPVDDLEVTLSNKRHVFNDKTNSLGGFSRDGLHDFRSNNEKYLLEWSDDLYEDGSMDLEITDDRDLEINLNYDDDGIIEGINVR